MQLKANARWISISQTFSSSQFSNGAKPKRYRAIFRVFSHRSAIYPIELDSVDRRVLGNVRMPQQSIVSIFQESLSTIHVQLPSLKPLGNTSSGVANALPSSPSTQARRAPEDPCSETRPECITSRAATTRTFARHQREDRWVALHGALKP